MDEKPKPKFKRRPIRNFIIMPDVQWPYIIRILAIVNLAGVLMATSICALFFFRYQANLMGGQEGTEGLSDSAMSMLMEENLMDVIIPGFIIADVVSLVIGLWLALYFSRKLSVPIFRIRKWAEVVSSGDLSFRLQFRPGDDLQGLENACNQVSDTYLAIIEDLESQLAEANIPHSDALRPIRTRKPKSLP
jgi:methyl-accepting chemotaxis protein